MEKEHVAVGEDNGSYGDPAQSTEQGAQLKESVLAEIAHNGFIKCVDDPNVVGEVLRAWAFTGDGYGCYSTFDVRPEFVTVKANVREFEILFGRPFDPEGNDEWENDTEYLARFSWFRHPNGIEVGWFWDGDGLLGFVVPELQQVLRNSDCKHNDEWEFGPMTGGGLRP